MTTHLTVARFPPFIKPSASGTIDEPTAEAYRECYGTDETRHVADMRHPARTDPMPTPAHITPEDDVGLLARAIHSVCEAGWKERAANGAIGITMHGADTHLPFARDVIAYMTECDPPRNIRSLQVATTPDVAKSNDHLRSALELIAGSGLDCPAAADPEAFYRYQATRSIGTAARALKENPR